MKVQIIGCGNMWEAILKAMLQSCFDANSIWVTEKREEKKEYLKDAYSINIWNNPDVDIILLWIKPQQLQDIDFSIYNKNAILVSILTGKTIYQLKEISWLENVIRVMPNLAIMAGYGTVWYVWDNDDLVNKIFGASSQVIKLKDEDQIDKITTVSGSSPAYFLYLAELLEKQSIELGFDAQQSKEMVKQVLIGTAKVLESSDMSISQFKDNITSKWWTTKAALDKFEELDMEKILAEGIQNAYKRAKELRG